MSKVYRFESKEKIASEARSWLVRMDSDLPLTEEEQQQFDQWMRRGQTHRDEFERINRLYGVGDILQEIGAIKKVSVKKEKDATPTSHRKTLRMAVAALVLVAVGYLGLTIQDYTEQYQQNVYVTDIGEIHRSVLSDGSVMHVNTDIKVKINFTPDYRVIQLVQGEAFFEVEHDTSRPFVVYARNSIVEAVGTAFSVNTDGDETQIAVVEGRVDLAITNQAQTPNKKYREQDGDWRASTNKVGTLGENEMAVIDDVSLQQGGDRLHPEPFVHYSSVTPSDIRNHLAWREGYISLSGEPLTELVSELNRYIPQNIIIADPQIEHVRIGGGFKLDDIDGLFQVLESEFDISVKSVNNDIVLFAEHDG